MCKFKLKKLKIISAFYVGIFNCILKRISNLLDISISNNTGLKKWEKTKEEAVIVKYLDTVQNVFYINKRNFYALLE